MAEILGVNPAYTAETAALRRALDGKDATEAVSSGRRTFIATVRLL